MENAPATENGPASLFMIIHDKMMQQKATQEYGHILGHAFPYFTPELQRQLDGPPPADMRERASLIDRWDENLRTISSALQNFPRFRPNTKKSKRGPANESITNPGSVSKNLLPTTTTLSSGSGDNTATTTASTKEIQRNHSMTFRCLLRDGQECILTGRPSIDGFPIEGAHIIPYALGKHPSCRVLQFWKMVELFYGREATNAMFNTLVENINELDNMVSLDRSTHGMFDSCRLTLTPLTLDYQRIPVFNTHHGSYLLLVNYPQGMTKPELIPSTRVLRTGNLGAIPLIAGSMVPIVYQENAPEYTRKVPAPGYFALRQLVVDLQNSLPPRLLPQKRKETIE